MQTRNASLSGVKITALLFALGIIASGCASTQGSHRLVRPPEQPGALNRYSDLIALAASPVCFRAKRSPFDSLSAWDGGRLSSIQPLAYYAPRGWRMWGSS